MKYKLLISTLGVLLCASAYGQNVKVVNPDSSPAAVKIISGGAVQTADPHVISAPGTTPSPSPAKAVVVQGIAGGTTIPVTSTAATATTVVSSALEASHVLKASAGSLVSLHVYSSSGSDQFILIMNSATVPSNGAVTLLYPPIKIPAGSNISLNFTTPLTASTGISVSNSSTGTFTKTIGSADCVFTAQVQ